MAQQEEYDLKKSTDLIGQLYPILIAKDGEVLDGVHRVQANRKWKFMTLEHIDTEEKKVVARFVANFNRRKMTRAEKEEMINALARIYKERGFAVPKQGATGPGRKNEIIQKIAEVTGLTYNTIRWYLASEFKGLATNRKGSYGHTSAPAEEVIIRSLGRRGRPGSDYVKRLVERFKTEYKAELLHSPLFRKQVIDMIPSFSGSEYRRVRTFRKVSFKIREPLKTGPAPERTPKRGRGRPKKTAAAAVEQTTEEISIDWQAYYRDFQETCPDCLCTKCTHAETCIERVRPEGLGEISPLWTGHSCKDELAARQI